MRLAETMLCFLRPFNISHSLQTAAAVFSLGAELSLIHLSSFLGPPQYCDIETSAPYSKLER